MAIIQSGATSTLWTIDTASSAGRATLYDINGNAMCDVASLNNVLNALNAAVTFTLGGQSTVGFNVVSTSGTLTLSFEATIDNINWISINATPAAGGSIVTSTTANGQWLADISGFYAVRARVSAFTSGSMTVSLVITPQGSKNIAQAVTSSGTLTVSGTVTANIGTTNGLALDTSVNGILVSQGSTTSGEKGPLIQGAVTTAAPTYTTAQTSPLSLTTAGALRIDGSAVTQPVSGTVTANAGSGTFAVSGTVTANIGTTNGLALDTSVNGILVSQGSTTSGEKGPIIQGAVTTAAPAYTTAQTSPLSLTTAGALRIDGSAVTQPVSGTVTANQGTANTLANKWPVQVTDGTNTMPTGDVAARALFHKVTDGTNTAAVKAASTAAVAADPSLVVALSPNTPTPVAADNIASGTITTLGGAVTWGTQGYSGQVIQISGAWTGTLTFQFSIDGGTTWWSDTLQIGQGTGTFTSTTTVNGIFLNMGIGGYGKYRVVSTGGAFTGTATVAWDAGVGGLIFGAQALISDGNNNGPAAVKPGSTAPVAADPALVVAMSTNSYAAQDRTTITPGTKQIAVIGGMDGIGGIARAVRVGEFGTQRTTTETNLWHDAIEGSTVNVFWTQSTTTMTIAQTTGVLTLNNSNITTVNTDAIITSQRQFPKYPRNPLYVRFRANITANAAANHTLVEFGLGAPAGVTAVLTNGAFFRWTAAGNLNAVISFNSTEQSTQILAQGTISTTEYYYYDIIVDDDYARFIVSDSSGVPVVDTQVAITNTVANLWSVSHQPSFARVYTDATGGGTAIKLNISAHSIQILDNIFGLTWAEQSAMSMRSAQYSPTAYTQTPSFTTDANTTPSVSSGLNSFGGEFIASTYPVSTSALLEHFAFQVPSPYSLVLTGMNISPDAVTTAFTGGAVSLVYYIWINASTANTSTATGGTKIPLGTRFFTATQAVGNIGAQLEWAPRTPIVCLPGTFIIMGVKSTGTAVTAGIVRHVWTPEGYFM